jgi:hypothetical protein
MTMNDPALVLYTYRRCERPGTVVAVPGWTITATHVSADAKNTRTEYADDGVSVYHNGHYIDFHFWGDWDVANRRARAFATAMGTAAAMPNIKGKEGRRVRVTLR